MTVDITGTTQVGQIDEQGPAPTGPTRRRVFAMCSVGILGVTGLAACGSDEAADTATPAAPGTPAPAPSSAAAGGAAASLIALADVPVGSAVAFESEGRPVIVSQPEDGEVIAFQAVCPHQFADVVVDGDELLCPLHNSTFDMATGKNLTGPAAGEPLPVIEVEVVDGQVVRA